MGAAAVLVALAATVAILAILVVGLLRSHAEILRALHELGIDMEATGPTTDRVPSERARHARASAAAGALGRAAVDVSGELPDGGAARVAVIGAAHHTLLAFLSTGCRTCQAFWEGLAASDEVVIAGRPTRIVIITHGSEAESPSGVRRVAPPGVLTVMSSAAWDEYDVPVSPYFVLADGPSGTVVGEGAGTSLPQVLQLLERAMVDQ